MYSTCTTTVVGWDNVAEATPFTELFSHYSDVLMSTMASQITSLTIVYSSVYSGADQRKYQSSASLAFEFPALTGEFPAQRASNAENVSIWWHHHLEFNSALLHLCVRIINFHISSKFVIYYSDWYTYLITIMFKGQGSPLGTVNTMAAPDSRILIYIYKCVGNTTGGCWISMQFYVFPFFA